MAAVFNVTLIAILATIAGTKGFVVNQLGQLGGGSDCTPAHVSTNHSASQATDLTWVTVDTLGSQISCTVLPANNAALQTTNVYTQVITNTATITIVGAKGGNEHECAKVDSDAGKPGLFQQIANNVTVQKLANSATQASVNVQTFVHTIYDTEWQCTDNAAGQTKTLKVAQELSTTLSNTTAAKCTDNQVVCFNSADNDVSISCLDKATYCGASYECIPATAGGSFKEANLRAVCGGGPPTAATTAMPTSTTANSAVITTTSAAGITVMSVLVLFMVKLF